MIRVLLVLAAFALLYGCGQTSSPVETQEKQERAERAAPAPTTPSGTSDGVSGEEQAAAAYDADCRVAIYVAQENMSRQEAEAFSELRSEEHTSELQSR